MNETFLLVKVIQPLHDTKGKAETQSKVTCLRILWNCVTDTGLAFIAPDIC